MNTSEIIEFATAGMALVSSLMMVSDELTAASEAGKTKRKKRSCWVKPYRKTRNPEGGVQALLREYQLFNENASYSSYLRMDESCFEEILAFINDDIRRQDTLMRSSVPVKQKLATALRFLATGESFTEISENTKLSKAYVSAAIIEVCEAIYKKMRRRFLRFPQTKEDWKRIANQYEAKWQFPLCLGALDGKHISFTPSQENAYLFYNDKGFHSIVLLGMVDAFAKFTFIDIGVNGRLSVGDVLNRSDLMGVLEDAEAYFPQPRIIGNDRLLPYVIVADNAFPNLRNMLTPYNGADLTEEELIFNRRLSGARQNIKRAFSILVNRFRIMQKKILLNESKTKAIVKACLVLHNYLIDKSSYYAADAECIDLIEEDVPNATADATAININDDNSIKCSFKEYFCNEGRIS